MDIESVKKLLHDACPDTRIVVIWDDGERDDYKIIPHWQVLFFKEDKGIEAWVTLVCLQKLNKEAISSWAASINTSFRT